MTQPANAPAQTDMASATGWLSVAAWIAVVALAVNVAAAIGSEIGPIVVSEVAWHELLTAFGRAAVANLPAICILFALVDFAWFFGRCGDGEVFSERNLRTLNSGGEGMVCAAFASAIVTPTVLMWLDQEFRGITFEPNDLALGVGAMGLAIIGLAMVFRDALRLKKENDQTI